MEQLLYLVVEDLLQGHLLQIQWALSHHPFTLSPPLLAEGYLKELPLTPLADGQHSTTTPNQTR
jgi:hypothetical protein